MLINIWIESVHKLIAISGRKCFHSSDNLIDTPSYILSVHAQWSIWMRMWKSRFHRDPQLLIILNSMHLEVQVATAIVSNGPIMTMSSIR